MLTSSTAEPTAQASGFPPYVLKWRDCPMHLAISAERKKEDPKLGVADKTHGSPFYLGWSPLLQEGSHFRSPSP